MIGLVIYLRFSADDPLHAADFVAQELSYTAGPRELLISCRCPVRHSLLHSCKRQVPEQDHFQLLRCLICNFVKFNRSPTLAAALLATVSLQSWQKAVI